MVLPPAACLQDDSGEGCGGSAAAGGKLRPHLDEEQLKELLTRGPAAAAKARGWRCLHAAGVCIAGTLCSSRWRTSLADRLTTQNVPQVLRFTGGIERLFDKFADTAAQQRFKRRLDSYTAIWCCVNAHPGHIWWGTERWRRGRAEKRNQRVDHQCRVHPCFIPPSISGTTHSGTKFPITTDTAGWWRTHGSQSRGHECATSIVYFSICFVRYSVQPPSPPRQSGQGSRAKSSLL